MMLAFAEIRRARGRFISIIGALALITFLVLTLSALSDGLFYGSTGAYRSSNANGYAFSSDAEGSLIRSRARHRRREIPADSRSHESIRGRRPPFIRDRTKR